MPVFAHCRHCGLDFPARMAFAGGDVTITGSVEECPRCGHYADVMDGTFDFDQTGNPAIVSAPAWSRALIYRMSPAQARRVGIGAAWAMETVKQAPEAEEQVAEKFIKLLEREAPWLASFVKATTLANVANFATVVTFVFMLLTVFGVVDLSGQTAPEPIEIQITDEQLRKMFDEYLEEHGGDSPTPPANPTPTEPTPEAPPTTLA